jgi:N-acetylglucosaminyl-diphospho-decaprenol L-rhamnosyltransferase
MSDLAQVSIVVVTWNSSSTVLECLQSLAAVVESGLGSVVVVDNCSSDDTVAVIESSGLDVDLVRAPHNLGFAAASNIGIAKSDSRLILLLNPDATMAEDGVRCLANHMDLSPNVGICGPILRGTDGEIQATCARLLPTVVSELFTTGLRLGTPRRGRYVRPNWIMRRIMYPYDYSRTQRVEAISGAAMMLRRSVIDEMGPFDPEFLHCGEDIDLCARAAAAGWGVDLVPDALAMHIGAVSSASAEDRTTVESLFGTERYLRKNEGLGEVVAFRLILWFVRVPVSTVVSAVRYSRNRDRCELVRRARVIVRMSTLKVRSRDFDRTGSR